MSRLSLLGCIGLGALLCACSGTAGPSELGPLGNASTALAVDKLVSAHQSDKSTSLVSPAFTTSQGHELLVAFIATDGPGTGGQTVTTVTGGGVPWRLRQRSNAQAGDSEIWQAVAPSVLTGVTVNATLSSSAVGSIVVATFTGASMTLDGATIAAAASTGGPSASLTTKSAGSWIWGVGNDWDGNSARVVGPNQTKQDEYLSAATGDTFWVQSHTGSAGATGSLVTINDTAPTADRWNLALIEIPSGTVDTTPPSAPGNLAGMAASATSVNLTWTAATDNVGVAGYQVLRESTQIGTSATLSYADGTAVASTTYHYAVKAYDAAGNVGPSSNTVTITTPASGDTVPPTVSTTSPAANATVSGTVNVTANASDNVGVVGVQFLLDGASLGAEVTASPYATTWDTTASTNGVHALSARARDGAGNTATSASVSVTVSNSSQLGQWGPVLSWPEVSIHQALTYTGKILTFQGDFTQNGQQYLLDPIAGTYIQTPNAAVDLFCAGQAVTADGRILVIGGTSTSGGIGISAINAFDPKTELWTALAPMHHRRWYPTGTTLGDGRVLVTSGDDQSATDQVAIPEVYDVKNNTWSDLTGASQIIPVYPFMYQLPDGRILQAGASEVATSTEVLDIAQQTWTMLDSRVIDGASIVNYAPNKFMKCGSASDDGKTGASSNTAFTLDTMLASPTWQPASPMTFARSFVNLTNLPDGTVFATGGASDKSGYIDANAVLPTELWNPATGAWTTLAPLTMERLYHSGAVLLPDARVFVSGSGGSPPVTDQKSYQIYSPPYLLKGARPTITSAPSTVQYNVAATVQTPDGSSITRVSLIRTGSVTHSFDQNSRALSLAFAHAPDGSLTVQMPTNGNTAPPGYYMLFIVNGSGVPSVAAMVRFPAAYEDNVPPSAPTNLVATGGVGAVALSWTAATDNVGVTSYSVYRSTTTGFTPGPTNLAASGITTTSFNDSGLPVGTYFYQVTARDAAGKQSAPSGQASAAVTTDTVPPTAPKNLQATAIGGNQVNLSWTASTDNVGVTQYSVTRNGGAVGTVAAPSTTYTDTSAAAGATYSYTVSARDAAGNVSPPSNTATLTMTTGPRLVMVDAQVVTHQAAAAGTISSPGLTTTGTNELLVAFLASDGASPGMAFGGVTGGGLTWRLRQQTNAQFGTAEIWQAVAPTPLSGVVFTATRASGSYTGSMVVVAFSGADTSTDGAVGTGNAGAGAPSATLTTTRAGSLVWGVGDDWDKAIARTVGANQTEVDEYFSPAGDTYWVQRFTSPVSAAGTVVTVRDTAPAGDRYDLSVIEILAAP